MHPVVNLLQANILYHKDQLLSSLTPQQKQILAIAMAALSLIAAICLFRKCCFTAELKEAPKEASVKEKPVVEPKEKETVEDVIDLKNEESEEVQSKTEAGVELKEEPVFEQENDGNPEPTPSNELEEKETIKEKPAVELEEKETVEDVIDLENEESEEVQSKTEAGVKLEEEPVKEEPVVEQESDGNPEPTPPKEEIPPRDEKIRNVLIIGASRSGKTTLRNVLQNICHVAPRTSIFSSTVQPILHPPIDLGGYTFRVLDTPGLCEQAPIGKTARGNTEIVQLIENKVKEYFGGKGFENVDAAIMTFTVTAGFTPEDIESLNTFIPKLDSRTKKILIITRAESYTEIWRTQIRNDISRHPKLGTLIDSHFGGKENILFSGSLDTDTRRTESIDNTIRKIHSFRERLIKALLPVEEPEGLKKIRVGELVAQVQAFIDAQLARELQLPMEDQPTEEQPEKRSEVSPELDHSSA